jgi:transcriptional regulator with XRE-family HTH domain
MKMKVNATKIKNMREQRCWSQLQLSEMAGISLRTLQRVEAKSVASQETIKSIASVLELDCELLLPIDESQSAAEAEVEHLYQSSTHKVVHTEQPELIESAVTKDQKLAAQRKKLYINITLLILANLFGFSGVFIAYSQQSITPDIYMMLKNTLSITFLLSLLIALFRAYKKGIFRLADLT